MNSVKTKRGTELPLLRLKGKDYLQVAHRIQWFNEEAERFHVDTDFLKVTDDNAVARAKVTVFDKDGREVRHATATKQESKKDFPDFIEKSETGAIGRALALMGYGTQFALSDLDEGSRLADSPVVNPKATAGLVVTPSPKVESVSASNAAQAGAGATTSAITATNPAPQLQAAPAKVSTFRKNKPAAVEARDHTQASEDVNNGWE